MEVFFLKVFFPECVFECDAKKEKSNKKKQPFFVCFSQGMDFNIVLKDNKLIVRVAPNQDSTVELFCSTYTQYLKNAKQNQTRLKVLFDLRLVTLIGMKSCAKRLELFFGTQIQKLSEEALESCIVVVPNELLSDAIKLVFNLFPGSVPTSFTYKFPTKN
jgi:hypothetical protein